MFGNTSFTQRNSPPSPDNWQAVQEWRKQQRERLAGERDQLICKVRNQAAESIISLLRTHGPELAGRNIGFYWPVRNEVDLRPLIRELTGQGACPALPVIIARDHPLEFWQWDPKKKLCSRGLWGIPAPTERLVVEPEVLLVPLLGFDRAGHRLGNGGGYYDRTLAVTRPRPLTVGVGYAQACLESIHPQAHDIPMDVIVTEASISYFPRTGNNHGP